MIILRAKDVVAERALGVQAVETGLKYCYHKYVIRDDDRLFNALTGEAVVIENLEEDRPYLITNWFMIPDSIDPTSLSHIVRQEGIRSKDISFLEHATIFTTDRCNAACEYCFQAGCERGQDMSEKVALDVAKLVRTHKRRGSNINLRWFGGEPLMNIKALDTVCEDLNSYGVPFTSSMSSNGDIFPSIQDEKIKNWNLKQVQFTLDASGQNYDRIKQLPSGAYERLIDTVSRFEKLEVNCSLRIHFDPEVGMDEPLKVINDFKSYSNVSMYGAMLYGKIHTVSEYDQLLTLEDEMVRVGRRKYPLPAVAKGTYCQSDNRSNVCITMDGHIAACEHYMTEHLYGSIYEKERNHKEMEDWSRKVKYENDCKDCPMYPTCEILCNCPANGRCGEGYSHYLVERTKKALRSLQFFKMAEGD